MSGTPDDQESQSLHRPKRPLSRAFLSCSLHCAPEGDADTDVALSCCQPRARPASRAHCPASRAHRRVLPSGSTRRHPGWHAASLRAALSWLDKRCGCGRQHAVYDPHGLLYTIPSTLDGSPLRIRKKSKPSTPSKAAKHAQTRKRDRLQGTPVNVQDRRRADRPSAL